MSAPIFGFPIYSDVGTVYTPSFSALYGSWNGSYPLTNLQDRRLAQAARSSDALASSSQFVVDLGVARACRVFALPKHNLSLAATVEIRGSQSLALFGYAPGDSITALGGTFTRADASTCATYVDANGAIRTVAANVIRDNHYLGGGRSTLLEGTRVNRCLQSENFGTTWSAAGTPTRSAGAATLGDLSLDLIGDDSAVAIEGYQQSIVFSGDGVKAVSVFFAQGTSTSTQIRINDTTASAERLRAHITWSSGVPSIAASTGTVIRVETLGANSLGSTVYRADLQTTSVTAANTNSLQFSVATNAAFDVTLQGTIYMGGVQCEDASFPSSYIKTTTAAVTRAADVLTFPWATSPSTALSLYEDAVYERASNPTTDYTDFVGFGGTFANTSILVIANERIGDTNTILADLISGGVTQSLSQLALTYSAGDRVERLLTLSGSGVVQISAAKNGGATTTGTAGAAGTPPGAFSNTTLFLTGSAAYPTFRAVRSVKIVAGVQTMATMQAAAVGLGPNVYDSTALAAFPVIYPTGSFPAGDAHLVTGILSAEDWLDADGHDFTFTHVAPSAQTARYWKVEIVDPANVAGYVSLGRLVIAGGIQPTAGGPAYGAALGLTSATTRAATDAAVAHFNPKRRRRTFSGTIKDLTETEALTAWFEMLRRVGRTKQVFLVTDAADTYHIHRRSFLAVFDTLPTLPLTGVGHMDFPFSLIEEL